jgi:TPR repeat protein
VRWTREGRSSHIFNPAAFGLGLFSIVLISTGSTIEVTRGIEVSTTLGLPPFIYLEIFLLGLVAQYLFQVTLTTFSAMASLVVLNLIYTKVTGVYQFVDTNVPIAIFLGLHLLVTDPATSPRTNVGRVIFGTFYGIGSFFFYGVLRDIGAPEFYDKLLTVPLLNLSVLVIDRVARMGPLGWFQRWQASFTPRASNLVYMGCWSAFFALLLATGFVQGDHPGASFAFWRKAAAEGKPRADENVVKMLRAAADRGSGEAANDLGELFLEGGLVERNDVLALNYFAQACDQGYLRGCTNLVAQFLAVDGAQPGELVLRSLATLESECGRKLPRRGCYLVGLAYERGRGRPRDLERALSFYDQAARRGSTDACKALIRLSLLGQPVDLDVPVSRLAQACTQEDSESCLYLAYLNHAGPEGLRDEPRAAVLLERACTLGSPHACAIMADPDAWEPWLLALRTGRP